jgi:hypothetical protein
VVNHILAEYAIASAYNTNIFTGDLVELHTDGTITVGAAAQTNIVGVFDGCYYVNSDGEPKWSKYWPASTTATDIAAFVIDDPDMLYEVQEDSSDVTVAAGVGSNADMVSTHSGSTSIGRSKQELDSSSVATTAAQLRIISKSTDPDNSDATAANCNWIVRINEHLYSGSGTAGI